MSEETQVIAVKLRPSLARLLARSGEYNFHMQRAFSLFHVGPLVAKICRRNITYPHRKRRMLPLNNLRMNVTVTGRSSYSCPIKMHILIHIFLHYSFTELNFFYV